VLTVLTPVMTQVEQRLPLSQNVVNKSNILRSSCQLGGFKATTSDSHIFPILSP
jgi:hypothetical protein